MTHADSSSPEWAWWTTRDGEPPRELQLVIDAALKRNARQPVVLDLRGLSDATDWFVVASGDSDTHVRAIAESVVETLKGAGIGPSGVEGAGPATWILIDYITVVVHIFLPRVREFYDLESLWGDAPTWALQ